MVSIAGAAVGAGVGREIRRAALIALPLGLLVMAVNMLVAQGGLTVIARLGDLPVFGQTDVTLEATVYGAVLGVRAVALILCGALYTVAVDPDEVLGLFRRVLVPLRADRDARDADGAGARAGRPAAGRGPAVPPRCRHRRACS